MANLIEIDGFPELAKALAETGPGVSRALRAGLVDLAEPIARDAEQFALENISGLAREKRRWEKMRVGITSGFRLVYVAPVQRGIKTRGFDARRRPQFADLMAERAMTPAVAKNEDRLVEGAVRIVDDVIRGSWG